MCQFCNLHGDRHLRCMVTNCTGLGQCILSLREKGGQFQIYCVVCVCACMCVCVCVCACMCVCVCVCIFPSAQQATGS